MEYSLNLNSVINNNRKTFLKNIELMKTDTSLNKRQYKRLLDYFNTVVETGDILKNIIDTPRFVDKVRHNKSKELFCINKQKKPVFYSKPELEYLCNLRQKKQLELLNCDFEKYWSKGLPLNELSRPLELILPNARLWYRTVVADTAGEKFLLEITLNCVITELMGNHRDLSAEYLLIDDCCNCKLRDENNVIINNITCKDNFFNIQRLQKVLFYSNSVSSIYAVELFKIGEGKLKNYNVYGDILRPIPLLDDELFALFDGVDLKPNKTKKSNKQKKTLPQLTLQSSQALQQQQPLQTLTETISNDTTYILTDSDSSNDSSSDSDNESNKNEINKNETPIFSVDFCFNISQQELLNITEMLYNLYDENDNFCNFIIDNKYFKIVIIKGLHYDANKKLNSLHFSAILIENITNKPTKPYHFYIKNGVIVSITEIRNLI